MLPRRQEYKQKDSKRKATVPGGSLGPGGTKSWAQQHGSKKPDSFPSGASLPGIVALSGCLFCFVVLFSIYLLLSET